MASGTRPSSDGGSSFTLSFPERLVFVNIDDRYKCMKCHNVLRRPMQTSCGHRMCDICVDELFAEHGDVANCPGQEDDCEELKKNDPHSIFKDVCVRREMARLKVYCPYANEGCASVLKWKDIDKHALDCEYRPVLCPMGCGERIPQNALENHENEACPKRQVICPHCGTAVSFEGLQEHVNELCQDVLLSCPHCGAGKLKRAKMEEHYKKCPKKPRGCSLGRHGCEFTGPKSEVQKHEESAMKDHIKILSRALDTQDFSVDHFAKERQKVEAEVHKVTEKLRGLSVDNTVHNWKKRVEGAERYLTGQKERVLRLEEALQETASADNIRQQTREIAAIKEDQQNEERKITRLENSTEQIRRLFASHEIQIKDHESRLSDVGLRFQIQETVSYNGDLIWKIMNYRRRKVETVCLNTPSLYSQPFYTSRHGYKMCARAFLNGDGPGKGTHLSLFFVVMKGDYDALLVWPFQQKVTFLLLAQDGSGRNISDSFRPDPSSSSFQCPTSDMNLASGCPLFVSHNDLESTTYLKDDTLFLKVVVDTHGLYVP